MKWYLPLTNEVVKVQILLLSDGAFIHSPDGTNSVHFITVQTNGVIDKIAVLLDNALDSLINGVLLLILLEVKHNGRSTRSIGRFGNLVFTETTY